MKVTVIPVVVVALGTVSKDWGDRRNHDHPDHSTVKMCSTAIKIQIIEIYYLFSLVCECLFGVWCCGVRINEFLRELFKNSQSLWFIFTLLEARTHVRHVLIHTDTNIS